MADAAPAGPGTAPLVVECATWEFALGYATAPGHAAKPRVVRETGPAGPCWTIHVQVPCGPARHGTTPGGGAPRATGPDARDFWRLLRAT